MFDCDGLLLDTESCWTAAETELFARYGVEFTPVHKAAIVGGPLDRAGAYIADVLDRPGKGDALAAELVELVFAHAADWPCQPMPGAADLLDALGGHPARPMAVASNSSRAFLELVITRASLGHHFHSMHASDDPGVTEAKPAPDLYLLACASLGAPPHTAVALEDSPTGVAAARAAGLFVIGVPSSPGLDLEADLVVDTLEDPRVWRAVGL